ncbi:hypothetical protein [Halalkalibacter alkalisediminis]|uniref:Uncharacterized protein n=1 Tax=Halalkalibacter alkalisediminis TaxID=935616 RepID=A0ABV6NGB9_9BACI|nr:hypothetical protein [Halalkalibacter alkalisediminis]
MRYELVYFLQNMNDEKVIAAFIKKLDAKSLTILFQYLALTDDNTQQKWVHIYQNLF